MLNQRFPSEAVRANRLKAVVLDWAGTTVDFGSLAPARTLLRTFAEFGIHLTEPEVRSNMGLPKKDHVRSILAMARVGNEWRARHGRAPTSADVETVYQQFMPLQLSCLAEYSRLIPGVVKAIRRFRDRGLKIGSTTGYTRTMLDLLLENSAKEGYRPDVSVAPEDVGAGRPEPFMIFENAVKLQVSPLASIVKIGDTAADIHEGLNAGVWSVGVAGTGNGIGLGREEFDALPSSERRSRLRNARLDLERAGAHYVVETLTELDPVLDDIDARLRAAEPHSIGL